MKMILLLLTFALVASFIVITNSDFADSVLDDNVILQQEGSISVERETQVDDESILHALITEIVRRYAKISDVLELKMAIYDFRNSLINQKKHQHLDLFEAALDKVFPALASELKNFISAMDDYQRWLLEDNAALMVMNVHQLNLALWEKRHAMFGDDAKRIWADEADKQEQVTVYIHNQLDRLSKDHSMTIDDSTLQFISLLQEVEGEYLALERYVPTYLNLESVQIHLQQLSSLQRETELAAIRRSFGMDELQIEKLQLRDQKRQKQWDVGYSYMEQKAALEHELSGQGSMLAQQLEQLRETHFGKRAPTIAKEESSGFYRFKRPRAFGIN